MSVKTILMTSLRRNWRRARQTWKLYKRSKIGLLGLTIMMGFVFVAVFAPIIAPYDPQFAAPNEDVFVANFVNRPLDGTGTGLMIDAGNETWHQPIPIWGESPNYDLRVITTYSTEGHAVKYNVEVVTSGGIAMGIDLWQPSAYDIPENTTFMNGNRNVPHSFLFYCVFSFFNDVLKFSEHALSISPNSFNPA